MRNTLRLGALAALVASVTVGANVAPAQSPNDQIVGTWTLTEVYDQHDDGTRQNPWGPGVMGQLTYTPNGRFSLMIMAANRLGNGDNPRVPVGPALAYFGSYVVRGADVVHLPERSSFPPFEGHERPLTTKVTGDVMEQTAPAIGPPGKSFVPHLDWTRSR
ncbi:MAG: lipocalin-like domain-containing protein [Alphaproteobacteria bacterium]|nr:lipocalin-like domain-containing protein [Alphaproteobacteria bacterium]